MNNTSYLIFDLRGIKYGVSTHLVKEIFLLPELVSIAETPLDIVGVLNLRGKITPIMHLDLRLGDPMQECKISDSIIVLELQSFQIGIIVSNIFEVKNLDSQNIENDLHFGRITNLVSDFIIGIAKDNLEEIILLNGEALIRKPDEVKEISENQLTKDQVVEESHNPLLAGNFYDFCCPNVTSLDKAVFRQRAHNLRVDTIQEGSRSGDQASLAILSLGGEYFGINLELVREFIKIQNFTPIPCSPRHILGNINLRGEVLTLVDIRSVFNLPLLDVRNHHQAVVVAVDDIVFGLPVDEVLDVMYLQPEAIDTIPLATHTGKEYLRGTVSLGDQKILSVIDLPKLIYKEDLIVNNEF
jgi:purine-binding chemotaxis protein CheW